MTKKKLSRRKRLKRIAEIIEAVTQRCVCYYGQRVSAMEEMEQTEMSEIYSLAKGKK